MFCRPLFGLQEHMPMCKQWLGFLVFFSPAALGGMDDSSVKIA